MKLSNQQKLQWMEVFVGLAADNLGTPSDRLNWAAKALNDLEKLVANWPDDEQPKYGPVTVDMTPKEGGIMMCGHDFPDGVRNPERINFNTYPIPPGYTVASEKDCDRHCSGVDWLLFNAEKKWSRTHGGNIVHHWTYLRPVRADEKLAEVAPKRAPHNPENIDLEKWPLPPGYVIASKGEIPEEVPDGWLFFFQDFCGPHNAWNPLNDQCLRPKDWTYARPIDQAKKEGAL